MEEWSLPPRMFALLWTLIVCFHGYAFCYENLSRRRTTVLTQSSTYNFNIASIANDGDVQTDEHHCAHTAHNHTKAWLQVDFGQPYRIYNVTVYYRREGDELLSWKQYRFRQFYLDVSNKSAVQTTTLQRTRCYTDNSTAPDLPPNIIDITCKETARYVIVETTYDAPEDDYLDEHGAILEICEIKVYGCEKTCRNNVCDDSGNCTNGCVHQYWGPACESQCPPNCDEPTCDSKTGYCISCKSGYLGDTCYSQCPMHCFEGVCNKNNGNCIKGCSPGLYGDTCDNTCSHGCVGGTCDQQSGICHAGCKTNWTGYLCGVCDATHYGRTCSLECNINCLNNTCNGVTGSCKDGCAFGKFGDFCNETCDERCGSSCYHNTEKYKKLKDSNSETVIILYGVITVLCISLIINGCMIKWNLIHGKCTGKDVKQETMSRNVPLQDFISTQDVYDTAEDNTTYQTLGQLSGSSHYDQLQLKTPS